MDLYLNLGSYSSPVTTTSPEAQTWFDRGLMNVFGFNHEEAIECFRKALKYDAKCGMAHWGISYSNGINYNSGSFMLSEKDAYDHAQHALQNSGHLSALEKDLIKALSVRYIFPLPEEESERSATLDGLNKKYAEMMKDIFEANPSNAEVISLYAESLMDVKPWKLWAPESDLSLALSIKSIIEDGLDKFPDHAGLLHLYVHCMELSPTPEKALPAANKLRTLVPDSGHLLHMPSHIDMWLGDYPAAVASNVAGVEADEKYVAMTGCQHNVYLAYRMHNFHFLAWACMFDGQSKRALNVAREMEAQLQHEVLESHLGKYVEGYTSIIYHVWIRFGMWEQIIAEKLPRTDRVWVSRMATARYARGIAFSAIGCIAEAEIELQLLEEAMKVPEFRNARVLHNNTMLAILEVGHAMLLGELAYRRGDFDAAFAHLRESTRLDDTLNYDEPWGWMQPARHALAGLLLEQGHVTDSESEYQLDLRRYPNNMWSLIGLYNCLSYRIASLPITDVEGKTRLTHQLALIKERKDKAMAHCDVTVAASCFCVRPQSLQTPIESCCCD